MPIYEYKCLKCDVVVDQVVSLAARDQRIPHEGCPGWLLRQTGLGRPTIGAPAYQMQAVLGNGAKLKGHFGKEAKRHRKDS